MKARGTLVDVDNLGEGLTFYGKLTDEEFVVFTNATRKTDREYTRRDFRRIVQSYMRWIPSPSPASDEYPRWLHNSKPGKGAFPTTFGQFA